MKCKLIVFKIITTAAMIVTATFTGCCMQGDAPKYSQNRLTETLLTTDVVATGNSYFSLEKDSAEVYVRSGTLCVLSHGELALRTVDGVFPFSPLISIPSDAKSFEVDLEGIVTIRMEGIDSSVEVGQIECNRFAVGRLLGESLSSVLTSDVAPMKDSFGLGTQAIVLAGWRSQNER